MKLNSNYFINKENQPSNQSGTGIVKMNKHQFEKLVQKQSDYVEVTQQVNYRDSRVAGMQASEKEAGQEEVKKAKPMTLKLG